mgnify:CR=1 FL=1
MDHQFAIQFLLLLTQYFRQAYTFKPYAIDQCLKAPQDQANSFISSQDQANSFISSQDQANSLISSQDQANSFISSQDQANSLISLDFQFTQIPHAF